MPRILIGDSNKRTGLLSGNSFDGDVHLPETTTPSSTKSWFGGIGSRRQPETPGGSSNGGWTGANGGSGFSVTTPASTSNQSWLGSSSFGSNGPSVTPPPTSHQSWLSGTGNGTPNKPPGNHSLIGGSANRPLETPTGNASWLNGNGDGSSVTPAENKSWLSGNSNRPPLEAPTGNKSWQSGNGSGPLDKPAESKSWLSGNGNGSSETPTENKSWLSGNSNGSSETPAEKKNWLSGSGNGTPASPSLSVPRSKKDMALSIAATVATSAATVTAGAIVIGAKAATKAATKVVASQMNSSTTPLNNSINGGTSTWKRMPWSKSENFEEPLEDSETMVETSAAPSWTNASSAVDVGGNSDYGVTDHIEETTSARESLSAAWENRPRVLPSIQSVTDQIQETASARESLSAAWNNRPRVLPSIQSSLNFPRRNTSPAIFGVKKGDRSEEDADDETVDQNEVHLAIYGGLLSRPPSTITFVIRRRQTTESDGGIDKVTANNPDPESVERTVGSSRQKLRELLGIRLVKTPNTHHRFMVVREDWKDVEETKGASSQDRDETESKEVKPSQGSGETEGEVVEPSQDSDETESDDVEPSQESDETESEDIEPSQDSDETESENVESSKVVPLLPTELTVLLRPGDFLESVDGILVGGRRRSIMALGKWDEENLYKTILVATAKGSQQSTDEEDAGEGVKTTDEKESSLGCYTTTLTFVCPGTTPSVSLTKSKSSSSDTKHTTTDSSESSMTPSVTLTDIDTSSKKESLSETALMASHNARTMVHKAYYVDQSWGKLNNDESAGLEGVLENFLAFETVQKSVVDPPKPSRFSIGDKSQSPSVGEDSTKVGPSLLRMKSIPKNHWLGKQTKIKANDVILCADDIPCYNGELSPRDLSAAWREALLTKVIKSNPIQDAITSSSGKVSPTPFVGISTCTIPPNRMQALRKHAIAATGGTLVGTGAVLMATPFHPVGHAIAIGGLGVLGTEFEGPRKAFQKVKESAASLAAKVTTPKPAPKATEVPESAEDEGSSSEPAYEEEYITSIEITEVTEEDGTFA